MYHKQCEEMANLSVFVPLRVSPNDALTLQKAATAQNLTRSAVLRRLIRSLDKPRFVGSLNLQQKPEAPTAC